MTRSPASRLAQKINDWSLARLLPILMTIMLLPGPRTGLVRLGTSYGGWWVPAQSLRRGAVALCAGAGEDISFDLALFDKGLNVAVFDPTPRAIAHVKQVAPNHKSFVFVPVGWWNEKATLKFYAPRDELHVSHSVVNLQRMENFFEAEVSTVAELAESLGHREIEIIKMDIEGAEHAVIHDLIKNGPKASTLCIEFDQPDSIFKTISAVRRLRAHGYRLRRIESWNYTFTADR